MPRNSSYLDGNHDWALVIWVRAGYRGIEVRTCADVEPIGVIRGKFLVGASLHNVDPCWHLEFSRSLEVRGVSGDKCVCTNTSENHRFSISFGHRLCICAPDVPYSRHVVFGGLEERARGLSDTTLAGFVCISFGRYAQGLAASAKPAKLYRRAWIG